MTRRCGRLFPCAVLLIAAAVFAGTSLGAQGGAESDSVPSIESLEGKIAEITANETLDAQLKKALLESYQASLRTVQQIEQARRIAQQFKEDAQTAAERAARLSQEARENEGDLEQIKDDPHAFGLQGKSIEELGALQSARNAEVAALEHSLQDIESRDQQRTARRAAIEQEQAGADARRAELQRQLAEAAPAGQSPLLSEARRLQSKLELDALGETQTAIEFELAKYSAEESVDLLAKTVLVLQTELQLEKARLAAIDEQIRRLREKEASTLEQKVVSQASDFGQRHPLREVAEANLAYVGQLQEYLPKIDDAERERDRIREQLEQQRREFADIKGKVEMVGLTRPIGLFLREQRSELPDLRERQHLIDVRVRAIETEMQQSWDYEREREHMLGAAELVAQAEQELEMENANFSGFSDAQRQEYRAAAEELLETRGRLLAELEQRSKDYFRVLTEVDSFDRNFVESSREYLQFINQRILWTRSAELLAPGDVMADVSSWRWLIGGAKWWDALKTLAVDAVSHPFRFWLPLLTVSALLALRLPFRRKIRVLGETARKRGMMDYTPTMHSAALTVLSAAAVPCLLWFLSNRLFAYPSADGFRTALSVALAASAAALFPLELLREVCRHSGLAVAHFNWSPQAARHVRFVAGWLKILGIPVLFMAVMAHEHGARTGGTPTDRILFCAGMLLVAYAGHRLIGVGGPLAQALKVENPDGWFTAYQRVWHFAAVVAPLGLAGLSIAGFHYSAIQLSSRMLWTVWLAVAVKLVRSLAVRWIVLSRRRILFDQANQRRAAAAEEDAQEGATTPVPPVVEETDVIRSTAQTRRLLDAVMWAVVLGGLWFVWSSVIPALGLLDRPISDLWADEVATSVAESDLSEPRDPEPLGDDPAPPANPALQATGGAAGVEAVGTAAPSDPIAGLSWLDLFKGILVGLFTILASRNLPGLLEISILERLPVDHATRYAATRLTSYTIVIVGILMVAKSVGLEWQNVQWMAAALTVGLGFGLQEIFANFISGLIVLFERPIRVGDTVTIGDTMGVVSRIRMRATTITNWDRQEFIVPNKDLITGRLLNWTLSNATTRMTIVVSVPTGSDTDTARELLLKAATGHPFVLDDPPPNATFDGIEEGKLNLTLRVYLDGLDPWFDVIHDLHTRIVRTFQEADLAIAITPRDLHIRSLPPEWNPAPVPATDK